MKVLQLAYFLAFYDNVCLAETRHGRHHKNHHRHQKHAKARSALEVDAGGQSHDREPRSLIDENAALTAGQPNPCPTKTDLFSDLSQAWSKEKHWWPHMRGPIPLSLATAPMVIPGQIGAMMQWEWKHPEGQFATVIAGGPLVDGDGNIFLATHDAIRKFNPYGTTLWIQKPPEPGDMNNAPFLMDDMVIANTHNGQVFALNVKTGRTLWTKKVANTIGFDTGYPAGYNGVYIMAADKGGGYRVEGGNLRVIALEAKTGHTLWEYKLQTPVWNFMPMFPGDDSVMFMDWTGSAYKLDYQTGKEIWKSPIPEAAASFSNGGLTIGPDNKAYTCSNANASTGQEGGNGLLRALSVVDGKEQWRQLLPQPCNSQALIGEIHENSHSVVINIGANYGDPFDAPKPKHSGVMVFDAETGHLQWQYQAPLWNSAAAKNELEGLATRYKNIPRHLFCLPAPWSAPVLAYDDNHKGVIYMGHGDGNLYILRGASKDNYEKEWAAPVDIDFHTTQGVDVETVDLSSGFYHGATALSPGKLAIASCDTLHVFNIP